MPNVNEEQPRPAPGGVGTVAPPSPYITLDEVRRVYPTADGGGFTALDGISLTVAGGEFCSVVGPSGCGKSSLLGLISGLARQDSGRVEVLGSEVRSVRRDVGFIFQKDALLPWRTAVQNVALPLRFRGATKADATEQAQEWLRRVGLGGFADRYPHQLSGGMRKRVSVAATLAYRPPIILMDEPFSALDVQTRTLMEDDLLRLWDAERPTVLFITHDLEEAIGLSDRVVVMSRSPGRVIGDHVIDLPRPRNLMELRFDDRFVALHHALWEQLRTQVGPADEH